MTERQGRTGRDGEIDIQTSKHPDMEESAVEEGRNCVFKQ